MELRKHVAESTVTMSKTAEGKVKVTNTEVPSGDFVWDFHLTPAEARRFGQELIRLADVLVAVSGTDGAEPEVDDLDYSDACIDLRPHVWIDTGTNLVCQVCDAERG